MLRLSWRNAILVLILSGVRVALSEGFYFEAWPDIRLDAAGPLQAIDIGGKRIEYYDVGKGPVVLLLHGAWTDATDWKEIIGPLARDFRLIVPDGMVYPYSTDDLWQLIEYLKIGHLALAGHSAGGVRSRELYFREPSRFWAFVNIDSGAIGGRAYADRLPNDRAYRMSSHSICKTTPPWLPWSRNE